MRYCSHRSRQARHSPSPPHPSPLSSALVWKCTRAIYWCAHFRQQHDIFTPLPPSLLRACVLVAYTTFIFELHVDIFDVCVCTCVRVRVCVCTTPLPSGDASLIHGVRGGGAFAFYLHRRRKRRCLRTETRWTKLAQALESLPPTTQS